MKLQFQSSALIVMSVLTAKRLAQKNRKRGPHRKRYSPLIVYSCVCALAELVDDDTRAELRLEPGGLRWHDVARVSDVHDLLHRDGVEG